MNGHRLLHSWREIASYTGRGVRTIQRYETDFGFPVHRPDGSARGRVIAFCDEIDSWLSKAPKRAELNGSVPVHKLTEEQIKTRRRYIAVAASAKHSQEISKATFESCMRQAKRIEDMIQKVQRHREARLNLPPPSFIGFRILA